MSKSSLTALTFATVAAISLPAQTTTETPAQEASAQLTRLSKLLTLTTAQQALALPIFTAEETTLATVETSLAAARTALEAAVLKNDLNTINTEAALIGTLTAQEVGAQAKAEAAIYVLLTPAQQTIFTELKVGGIGHGGHR